MHDIDLGKPMSDDKITSAVREDGDQDVVRAILQRIRNDAVGYMREGQDELSDAQDHKAKLKIGAAQGLEALFWDLLKQTPYGADLLADTD